MPDVDRSTFSYEQDAESNLFTEKLYRVVPPGVYHGMELVKEGSIIHVLSGVSVIRDTQGHQTTAIVDSSKDVTPTEEDNIVLLTWEWQSDPSNKPQIITASSSTGTDVVLGQAVYNNGSFDSVNQDNRDLPTWTKNPGQASEEDLVLIPEINSQ